MFDALGMDYVLLETVGVGQSELEIADTADTTVVVLMPGLGDSVQTIKAGIMEIADIFVVNKGDHPAGGADRCRPARATASGFSTAKLDASNRQDCGS